ncbi:MAG: SusC/RagA family TonB-linked outer membrane protein [Odoribacter sp.]
MKKKRIDNSSFQEKQFRFIYKPLLVTLFFLCLQVPVLLNAQGLNLQVKNASLIEVVERIKQQSKFTFVFNTNDLEKVPQITLDIKDASIETILNKCLEGSHLTFTRHDHTVVFKRKEATSEKQLAGFKLSGRVTDSQGNPLPGASIIIKGSTMGAATDSQGKFEITLPSSQEVLEITFIGMQKKEIKLTGQAFITIQLSEEKNSLSEVVCTGYQTIRKDRNTGSVEVIEAKDLAGKPFVSVDQLLIGKLAGISGFMASGQAGGNANINIRGVNTLSGSSQPLWIVDGLPIQGETPDIKGGGSMLEANILTNGIGNIAPSDIKSITVLKDAAAAAIYGAKAANGVIVITTKRGVESDLYCSYTGNIEIGKAPSPDLGFMNTSQKIQYERELWEDWNMENYTKKDQGSVGQILSDIKSGAISSDEGERRIQELSQYNTNWLDEIFHTSFSHTHNLSLSGGNQKMSYYSSLNYANNQGTLKKDKYKNLNVNLKGTYKPNDRFDLTFGVATSFREKQYHNSAIDPFKYAIYANPYESPYDKNGEIRYDQSYINFNYKKGEDEFVFNRFNILNELNKNGQTSNYNSTSLSLELNWYILKSLKYTGRAVKTTTNKSDKTYTSPGTYTSFINNWYDSLLEKDLPEEQNAGSIRKASTRTNQYSVNNSLDFNIELQDHFISAYIGQEISATKTEDFYTFLPEYNPDIEIGGYPNIKDAVAERINLNKLGDIGFLEQRNSSFYANASYGYRDCYIVSLNGRMDGADIIGSDNQFTPLWSVSGRWNLHKNNFFKANKILNELSLKAEYGYTGNINRNVYPFTTITISGTDRYNGVLIASATTYPNPVIKWENKHEKSVAIEMSLFNYRLNLNASYYHNKVNDVLTNKRLPISSGISGYYANVSDLLNKGYEISINGMPIKTDDFTLGLNFNIAFNKNIVSNSYYSGMNKITMDLVKKEQPIVDGYSIGAQFGVIDRGVNPETGERMAEGMIAQGVGQNEKPTAATEFKPQTVERDLLQDHDRVIYLGQTTPKYHGGFGLSFRYKNFDLSSNFNFEGGHIIPKFNERLSSPNGSKPLKFSKTNVNADRLNRWRQTGDISNFEKYDLYTYKANTVPMNSDYEKGDYLRCRNITLSYRLSNELLNRLPVKLKRAVVSFQADNLFTLTGYSGIDPELRKDFGYPLPKNYRFSLQIGF